MGVEKIRECVILLLLMRLAESDFTRPRLLYSFFHHLFVYVGVPMYRGQRADSLWGLGMELRL